MKSRKHLVSRILFTMLATDESNGVALNSPGNRFGNPNNAPVPIPAGSGNGGGQGQMPGGGGVGSMPQHHRTGLGPGILHSDNDRGHFHLEEGEDNDQSLEEGEEYDDELEEDPDDLLDKREKLLDSDVIPYHKKPGFCMFTIHEDMVLHLTHRTYTFHTHIVIKR